MKTKDYYVYLHRKKTSGVVFYVGKGCGKRAWSLNRSVWWRRVAKACGFTVEIVESGLQEWAACEMECELIALYGRADLGHGLLVNMTDGGEGLSNPSSEKREVNAAAMRKLHSKPEFKLAHRERLAQRWNDPLFREQHSIRMKQRHSDTGFKARLNAAVSISNAKPENKQVLQKRLAEMHSDATYKSALAERMRQMQADPVFKVAQSSRRIAMNNDPAFKQATVNRLNALWQEASFREALVLATKKANSKRVTCVEKLVSFRSMTDAVDWLKDNGHIKAYKSGISQCCLGRKEVAYGFRWQFSERFL